MPTQPRRSMLFMPATNPRAIEKSRSLQVDTIILDLEDSVPPAQKLSAREGALQALSAGGFGYRELLVRINDLGSNFWEEDVKAISGSNAHGIVVPKVERTQDLELLFHALNQHAAQLPVWIMLETPLGVLSAPQLCMFDPQGEQTAALAGVLLGTADLAKALNLQGPGLRSGLETALCQCVLSARAANLVIIDGVFMNVKDIDGLERECVHGKSLGFDGKTLIHPAQLEITNRVYAPEVAEVLQAREMIATWEAALEKGEGVCLFNGSLVEHLHVQQARELISYYDLIQTRS